MEVYPEVYDVCIYVFMNVFMNVCIKPRRLRKAGHVTGMEEGRSAFRILIGRTTAKRPLGRSSSR